VEDGQADASTRAHQTTTGTFVSTDFADACVTKSCPCRRTAIVARVRVAAGAARSASTSTATAARCPATTTIASARGAARGGSNNVRGHRWVERC